MSEEKERRCCSAATGDARPFMWVWRTNVGGTWGTWRPLEQPIDKFKKGPWGFNLDNGTAEVMPLYSHPPQSSGVQAERDRCVAICEGWMERFEGMEIQYTSPREYACDAINDIMDLIRDGIDPSSSVTRPQHSTQEK